ncbi:MAG: hypothetical protein ACTFAL_05075 [Candidatus Electronema sp. V4]|uniref:hypothetical protein n=1 Tax=Candidatus Electronema sp. V4 TaxID=3454756 RepID=UPI0040558D1F
MKYGCKGKGVPIHLIADSEGMTLSACSKSADADERKQVKPLLDGIEIHPQIPRKKGQGGVNLS